MINTPIETVKIAQTIYNMTAKTQTQRTSRDSEIQS